MEQQVYVEYKINKLEILDNFLICELEYNDLIFYSKIYQDEFENKIILSEIVNIINNTILRKSNNNDEMNNNILLSCNNFNNIILTINIHIEGYGTKKIYFREKHIALNDMEQCIELEKIVKSQKDKIKNLEKELHDMKNIIKKLESDVDKFDKFIKK